MMVCALRQAKLGPQRLLGCWACHRAYARGAYMPNLLNTDTWRLIGWAVKRDPGLLGRLEAYLRRWLGTGKAKAAERELKKLARIRDQQQ